MDPAAKKFFVSQIKPVQKARDSDYERQIKKSDSHPEKRKSSAKKVPQLGDQAEQSVPPLNVLSTDEQQIEDFVRASGLTREQLFGEAPIERHEERGRKKFVLGEPLMWPELIRELPTRMHQFHQWYMKASASGLAALAARVRDEHFHRGINDIYIDFEDFHLLFHQDALDKALISCWCM